MAATPSATERISSELAMNHTNAKTCLSRGIGGLPNACCWGTLPVASTSRHRVQKSLESEVAFKFIDRIHRQNISIKTFIFVKIAPLIGCSRRLDRNVIIIWINETLFFQREVFRYLPCETPWEQEVDVNSSDLADPMIQAIMTSPRKKRANAQNFGKWRRRPLAKQLFGEDFSTHCSLRLCCFSLNAEIITLLSWEVSGTVNMAERSCEKCIWSVCVLALWWRLSE